jgi:hypothetical protein
LLVRRQPLLESIVSGILLHPFLDYTWSLWSFARALYHLRHPARREK